MERRIISFEGLELECERVEMIDGNLNISPGDTYLGKRNQGWKMGTVAGGRLWVESQSSGYLYGEAFSESLGRISPTAIYPYNWGECWKVVSGL